MSRTEVNSGSFQKLVDRKVTDVLNTRRHGGEHISSAHNESNLRNTALLTQEAGHVYGFSPRELMLSYFAGSFHDIYRTPQEGTATDDEISSAQKAREEIDTPVRSLKLTDGVLSKLKLRLP